MSVGAGSIKRAAKAETKTETKAAVVQKPAEEVAKAAAPEKKAPAKPVAKKAPAKKAPAKKAAAKPAAKKAPAAKKPAAKAPAKTVSAKQSWYVGEELPIYLR